MKRKIFTVLAAIILILLLPISAYAHPGRTDSNGGHWDRKNGTYHYHNGGSSSGSSGGNYDYDYNYNYTTTKARTYASRVTISDTPEEIDVGESVKLEASVYPADSEDDEITWESSNAQVIKIDDQNNLTAVGAGTATVTAKTSRGTSSAFTVEVKEVNADSISIEKNSKTILIGASQKLNIEFEPENTTNKDVIWTSSDDSIVSITSDGAIKANKIGKVRITAAHKELRDSLEIEVLPIKAEDISIVYPEELEKDAELDIPKIKVNNTYDFKAEISPSDVTDKTIKWYVSDEEKAEIDGDGVLTALKSGVVEVIAETENGKKDTVEIKIYSDTPAIVSVSIVFCVIAAGFAAYRIIKKKKAVV